MNFICLSLMPNTEHCLMSVACFCVSFWQVSAYMFCLFLGGAVVFVQICKISCNLGRISLLGLRIVSFFPCRLLLAFLFVFMVLGIELSFLSMLSLHCATVNMVCLFIPLRYFMALVYIYLQPLFC